MFPLGPLKVTVLAAGSTLTTSADIFSSRPLMPPPMSTACPLRSVMLGFVPAGAIEMASDS